MTLQNLLKSLVNHVDDLDIKRCQKILEEFQGDIPAMLGSRKDDFIRYMRTSYKMNTRRMYSSYISHLLDSTPVMQLFPSKAEYDEAMICWKNIKKHINAEDKNDPMPHTPTSTYAPVPVPISLSEMNEWIITPEKLDSIPKDVQTNVYRDVHKISQKALEIASQNNMAGIIQYLINQYLHARVDSYLAQMGDS